MKGYKPSQFNCYVTYEDGTLLVRNLFSNTTRYAPYNKADEVIAAINGTNPPSNNTNLFTELLQGGFIVKEDTLEYQKVDVYRNSIAYRDELDLTILPTEECNFRCSYCFERERHMTMSQQTIDAIIKYLDKNFHKYQSVYIQWFGGEPLLRKDAIEQIMKAAVSFSRRDHVALIAGITTNGYLLDVETYTMLCKNKISWIQVSVDGTQDVHNKQRPHKTDPDSYSKILENLKSISGTTRPGMCKIYYRVNLSKSTIPHIQKILQDYKKTFGDDKRFLLSLQPVMDWGGDRVTEMLDDLPEVRDTIECIERANDYGLLPVGHHTQPASGLICEAIRKNGFVIRPTGQIIKCCMATYGSFEDDLHNGIIGQLEPNGQLIINDDIHCAWLSNEPLLGETCRRCTYYAICHGAVTCPFSLKFTESTPAALCKRRIYNEYIPAEMKALYKLNAVKSFFTEGNTNESKHS